MSDFCSAHQDACPSDCSIALRARVMMLEHAIKLVGATCLDHDDRAVPMVDANTCAFCLALPSASTNQPRISPSDLDRQLASVWAAGPCIGGGHANGSRDRIEDAGCVEDLAMLLATVRVTERERLAPALADADAQRAAVQAIERAEHAEHKWYEHEQRGQQRTSEARSGVGEDGSIGFDLVHEGRSYGAVTICADGGVEIVMSKREPRTDNPLSKTMGTE